jgi:hypothetical protein
MSAAEEGPKRTIPQVNALVRALVEQETFGYPFWIGGYVTRCFIADFGHRTDSTFRCKAMTQVDESKNQMMRTEKVGILAIKTNE